MDEMTKLRRIIEIKHELDCDLELMIRTKGSIDALFDSIKKTINGK